MRNPKRPAKPDMEEVLEETKREIGINLNSTQIGIINKFDATNQLANIQIAMKQVIAISDDGVKEIREYPLLLQCPVFTLFGGAGFLSMPVSVGDNCIVLFNDRQIDEWLFSGDGKVPNLSRIHDLSDAIAIVGIRPLNNSIANFITDGVRLSYNDTATLDLKDKLIESVAELYVHDGNMRVKGNLQVDGGMTVDGNGGGNLNLNADLTQDSGNSISAGNGATGTFDVVTVENGIVTGGS